jgi:thymidine phosphorylase
VYHVALVTDPQERKRSMSVAFEHRLDMIGSYYRSGSRTSNHKSLTGIGLIEATAMKLRDACDIFSSRQASRFADASDTIIDAARSRLSVEEVCQVAKSIAASGRILRLPASRQPFADCPSTGGPGSLSTLLCPLLLVSQGLSVPKISATGSVAGAIDTLGLIPGFHAKLSSDEFLRILGSVGIAHSVQSGDFCPADKVLVQRRRQLRLMSNAGLAAASLLGKKLAVPGTVASFDFRVGPAGNIGADHGEACEAAHLFREVSSRLGLQISITLTDCIELPCSALGRLEALHLLWLVINGDNVLDIDRRHVDSCVQLAARACHLGTLRDSPSDWERRLRRSIRSGDVKRAFVMHLEAQGSTMENLVDVLQARHSQQTIRIVAALDGFWYPPPALAVAEWFKTEQRNLQKMEQVSVREQLGLRMIVSPGAQVNRGQPVVEMRCPRSNRSETVPPAWLSGETAPALKVRPLPGFVEHLGEPQTDGAKLTQP